MRTSLSEGFKTYLLTRTAKTLARCWWVGLRNGIVLGFTTHTRNLVIDGVTYSSLTGLTTTAVKSSEGLSVDNLAISAFLASQDEREILKGTYDGAQVKVFVVNYLNLGLGVLTEKVGFVGEITRIDGVFQAELRGLMDMLRTKIGRVYSASCDARLGDSRCTVVLGSYTVNITAVTGFKSFQLAALASLPNDTFKDGYVKFLTGENQDIIRDIRNQAGADFDLYMTPPFPLVVGDTLSVVVGCDKTKRTCIDKFNNVINFRGFDFVPTIEQVFDSPVTPSPDLQTCATDDPGYGNVPTNDGGTVVDPSPPQDNTGGSES